MTERPTIAEVLVGVTSRLEVIKATTDGNALVIAIEDLEAYLDDTTRRTPFKIHARPVSAPAHGLDPRYHRPVADSGGGSG